MNRHQLQRNRVELLQAEAAFVDPHTLRLAGLDGRGNWEVSADRIVIAVGTTTSRASDVDFDGQRIFTSDQILNLKSLPRSLIVIGAGVIGLEYATIFAALGVRVTVVDKRQRLLSFIDFEIIDTLVYQMRQNRMDAAPRRRGQRPRAAGRRQGREGPGASGQRQADSGGMRPPQHRPNRRHEDARSESAGLKAADRGLIAVNESFQTEVPHIYAVGDVIGFPSLASSSMEQAASPPATPSARRRKARPTCSPTASTRFRRSPSSGAAKRS